MLIFLASCAHQEIPSTTSTVPVPEPAPKLFVQMAKLSRDEGRLKLEDYHLDCVLWNSKLPRDESLMALVHNRRDGKQGLVILKNFPENRYLEVVNEMLLKGRPVEDTVLGRNDWLAVCESDSHGYEPPTVRTVNL
ncbi:MAG: hypothetical protein WA001_03365 [Patescibacteria group bacterium]